MTLKQDLNALQREFKALGKKLEKLTVAVEKAEKTQAKAAKAKTVKKAPAKKEGLSEKESSCENQDNQGKKTWGEKESDKEKEMTATDKVLKIIKGSKKCVDADMKKVQS